MKKILVLISSILIITAFLSGCNEETSTSAEDMEVDIYDSDKAYQGTTLLPDNHVSNQPRVIEIDMEGEIVWEYILPDELKEYTNPGFDVELLSNDNILLVLPGKGVFEIDRNESVVWSYLDPKVSHDADRLSNGNTIVVYGNNDEKTDAQVKEVNSAGKIVWSWKANTYFDTENYTSIYNQGWTHTNAVVRMKNNNTLISPRNFGVLVEIDSEGSVVRIIGEGLFRDQHDPEVLSNGNILIANHGIPQSAIEIDPNTSEVLWEYEMPDSSNPVRDANRLPNGNTLITGTTQIVEVTTEGEIVWRLKLKEGLFGPEEASARGFYKAERLS